MKNLYLAIAILVTAGGSAVFAASDSDIDKLTTYAVMMGRGSACGAEMSNPGARVGAWMDRKFPPGSQDQKTYLPIFLSGVQHHAQQQRSGKSPDSCSNVLTQLRMVNWP